MSGTPDARPNIIFIMADDMGFGDPGCYGATRIPTPNMDRVAAEGRRFTDAHSSSAVCTPSRYSVLTGRYCWRTRLQSGVLGGFGPPLIEPDRLTVPRLLSDSGYTTAAIGKWHLGLGWTKKDGDRGPLGDWNDAEVGYGFDIDYEQPIWGGPCDLGFDYFFGIAGSLDMPPYCFIENRRTVGIPDREKNPYHNQQRRGPMTPGWDDRQVDVAFAEKAVSFIEQQPEQNPGRPFFLYLTPSAPHRPCVAPTFMQGRSRAGRRGDMVALLDWLVGQVTDALDRLDLTDDTLLIVTSDNGARPGDRDCSTYGHKSCGDWRGHKADIWDGGHREPFIARWPGHVPAGTVCGELIGLGDLAATCAALVGAELPDGTAEDSVNVLPAILGEHLEEPLHEAVVHHSIRGMFSLRKGPWKLIDGLGSGGWSEPPDLQPGPDDPPGQLYNLADDPGETVNLWNEHPNVVAELSDLLARYREGTPGDAVKDDS